MYPEENTLRIEYEQPDWEEYFKRHIWYALSNLNYIVEKYNDFPKAVSVLSKKTKAAIQTISSLTTDLKEDEYKP